MASRSMFGDTPVCGAAATGKSDGSRCGTTATGRDAAPWGLARAGAVDSLKVTTTDPAVAHGGGVVADAADPVDAAAA